MGKLFSGVGEVSLANLVPPVDGVGVAIDVGDDQGFKGRSNTVTLETVEDPFADQNGNNEHDDVLHITSGDEDPTKDIAMSLLDVRDRDLTVADIDDFTYEWAATERDVVGVGTDHEKVGSPDDVWFFLNAGAGTQGNSRSFFRNATPVFRTLYGNEDDKPGEFMEYSQWNTRDITEEFDAHGWKEFSAEQREFTRLDENILETYGETRVLGVGISRGDPFYGPSVLDSYYRNLSLAGEEYTFPTKFDMGRNDPR
jgi:hypothetical protein